MPDDLIESLKDIIFPPIRASDLLGLPVQLFPHRVMYQEGVIKAVDLRSEQGDTYRFRPGFGAVSSVEYIVTKARDRNENVWEIMGTLPKREAPSVLERIFAARTREAVMDLQANRQLIECEHKDYV